MERRHHALVIAVTEMGLPDVAAAVAATLPLLTSHRAQFLWNLGDAAVGCVRRGLFEKLLLSSLSERSAAGLSEYVARWAEDCGASDGLAIAAGLHALDRAASCGLMSNHNLVSTGVRCQTDILRLLGVGERWVTR
jgi:hypothetical protein